MPSHMKHPREAGGQSALEKVAQLKMDHDEKHLRRQFQKGVKIPKAVAPNIEPSTVGEKAKKWPRLAGEWLGLFPDFPYHIKGLRCCRVGDGRVNQTVYLGPKDREQLQRLVAVANDRLVDVCERWDLPSFRHAVPTLHKNPHDVVIWPPDFATLRAYPFTAKRGAIQPLPFSVHIEVPFWRSDGFFDEVRMSCDLDAEGLPHSITSHYKLYRGGIGVDYVRIVSHLAEAGWRYFSVEAEFNERYKALVSPFEECH